MNKLRFALFISLLAFFVLAHGVNSITMDITYPLNNSMIRELPNITVFGGDFWKVETPDKRLEMSQNNVSPRVKGEIIYDIKEYLSSDELGILAPGVFSNGQGNNSYRQYIFLNNAPDCELVKYAENDLDVLTDFFYVCGSGKAFAKYRLEFTSPAESDVTDITGNNNTTGTYLSDFEDTKISILDKTYDIVLARRYASGYTNSIKMQLMDDAVKKTWTLDESQTIEFNGQSYQMTLNYVDNAYAKFTVNGESTDKLAVGDTGKLSDGTIVGVTEIIYQDYAGGVQSATAFIGTGGIELKDDNITDMLSSYELKSQNEYIDGAEVVITGTDDNTRLSISSIRINMISQDDYFVPKDGKLSETITASGEQKEILFTNNWDIEYLGLTQENTHQIRLSSETDREYILNFYDGNNNPVAFPLVYANNSYSLNLGEEAAGSETKTFRFTETATIEKNNYFIVTGGDAAAGTARTYALQYKGADEFIDSDPKIKFKDLGSGDMLEYSVPTAADANNTVTNINLGGYTFKVENASAMSSDDFQIKVDMNADGDLTDGNPTIVDYYGAQIAMEGISYDPDDPDTESNSSHPDLLQLKIDTPNVNDYDNQKPSTILLEITATEEPELRAAFGMPPGTDALLTPNGETGIKYGYTTMGGKITFEELADTPAKFTYDYPEKQILPQLYVTTSGTTKAIQPVMDLNVTTDETAVCDYKVDNLSYEQMNRTNNTLHQQRLINLSQGQHQIFVQCTGQSGNSTASVNFYFGCEESWTCTQWSTCSGSAQTRTCTDSNACGTSLNKPSEMQTCTEPQPASSGGGGGSRRNTNNNFGVVAVNSPPITISPTPATNTPAEKPVKSIPFEEKGEKPKTEPPRGTLEFSLKKDEIVDFNIGKMLYSLKINGLANNAVQFTLNPGSVISSISLDRTQSYDFDKDGNKDISLYLMGISDGRAQLRIESNPAPLSKISPDDNLTRVDKLIRGIITSIEMLISFIKEAINTFIF